MPRFFVPSVEADIIAITGSDAAHIAKSLRMRMGDELILCDGDGLDCRSEIISVSPGLVEAKALERTPSRGEPAFRLRLYQALPKGEKLDFILQKAVELGICEFIPTLTSRCISRPDAKSMSRKVEKLRLTALEAAKQSGRGRIPEISGLSCFEDAIRGMKQDDLAILFYERAEKPLREVLTEFEGGNGSPLNISILIGSEGGFSPDEAEKAREEGIAVASLGGRILRCETAPLAALSCVLYAFGEI